MDLKSNHQKGKEMTPTPIYRTTIEKLPVRVYPSNAQVGQAAAQDAATFLQKTLQERGQADVILATGNSQLTFLENLCKTSGIDWSKVNFFHMDEYLGIDPAHPASFPLFLRRHFLDHLQPPAGAFFPVEGQRPDTEQACKDYEAVLRAHPADLCALGIGENGHLAFNDPPYADFNDPVWVKVVKLDEVSRRQQVGEGHFPDIDSMPTHAITLTIPALLAARKVLAIVPEGRKAPAVERALFGPIDQDTCPGSILRQTAHADLYLDRDSAALAFPNL
jgi:glucosamine-6-phosphate deaminase